MEDKWTHLLCWVAMAMANAGPGLCQSSEERLDALRANPLQLTERRLFEYAPDRLTRVTRDNVANVLSRDVTLVEHLGVPLEQGLDDGGNTRWILPYNVTAWRGHSSGPDRAATYRPELVVLSPMRYFADVGVYRGRLGVGLRQEDVVAAATPFPEGLSITMASNTLDEIDPYRVEFHHPNELLDVVVKALSLGSVPEIRLVPSFDSEAYGVELPWRSPTLAVTVSPERILGLGMETADVIVEARDVSAPGGMPVTLTVDAGRLAASQLVLDENGRARTSIRSVGLGEARVVATGAPFGPSESHPVRFGTPVAMAVAVLLGGAVGSVASKLTVDGHFWRALGRGLGLGILTVAAYAVGIRLLPVQPSAIAGETLGFVLSMLGAGGPALLSTFVDSGRNADSQGSDNN